MTRPFWETKSLHEMTRQEWEALCDGCGKCCLVLLEEEASGPSEAVEIWETDVACRLFDPECRRCRDYDNRKEKVPGCVVLTPENVAALKWMPESCAYRRLARGQGLAPWHPLISGDRQSVATAGIAVSAGLSSEEDVPDTALEDHITARRWPPVEG